MGVGAGLGNPRARAALGAAAVLASAIIVGVAAEPRATADTLPPVPFDSNGYDDSFAIAQSRPQGPVIDGSAPAAASRTTADASMAAAGDPVTGTFGAQVAWPIMPIHAVLLPDGRVLTYGTDRNGAQTAYYDYDVWDPAFGTGADAHDVAPQRDADRHLLQLADRAAQRRRRALRRRQPPGRARTPRTATSTSSTRRSNTLVRTGSMNRLRWYSSATVLPNGEVYIQGGSAAPTSPSGARAAGQFQLLTGASTNGLSSGYPKNFVGPDGLVFGLANKADVPRQPRRQRVDHHRSARSRPTTPAGRRPR